jgi:hypothetical protein
MLLLDGVDGPPTTELANALGAAAAIADPALGAAAAMADVAPMTARLDPAIAADPDGMEPAGFIPPELSCSETPTVDCLETVGSIADERCDSVAGILMAALAFFFLEGFWPGSEAAEIVAPSFTTGKVESTGRTGLRSECRDAEGESEPGCTPPSCAFTEILAHGIDHSEKATKTEIRLGRRHIDSEIFDNILFCSSLNMAISDLLHETEVSTCDALVEQDQYPESRSSTLAWDPYMNRGVILSYRNQLSGIPYGWCTIGAFRSRPQCDGPWLSLHTKRR